MELAGWWTRAGEAPRAAWSLEEAVAEHPAHAGLRLALADVALSLGNPALAGSALEGLPPEEAAKPEAILLRSRLEVVLGNPEASLALLAESEAEDPDAIRLQLTRIAALDERGRRDEALEVIEQARPSADDEGRRLLHLWEVKLVAQRDGEAARVLLEQQIERDPADALAWSWLVQLAGVEGRAELVGRLRQAIEAAPDRLGLHPILAALQIATGDPDGADRTFALWARHAESPAAFTSWSDHRADRGDLAGAVEVLVAGHERFPDDAGLLARRGDLLLALARTEEARNLVPAVRAAVPDGAGYAEYLEARLQLESGNTDAAARRLTALAPRLDQAATHYWLGRALEAQGDVPAAARRYSLAWLRQPSWPAPTLALVALAQREGDWATVARIAETWVRREPWRQDWWATLVGALLRLDRPDAALEVAERMSQAWPDDAGASLNRARALRRAGDASVALELLATAEALGADPVDVAIERGLGLAQDGRSAQAVRVLERALTEHPEAAALHEALASVHFARGDEARGSAAVDRALQLDPDRLAPWLDRCRFRVARASRRAASDCEAVARQRPRWPEAQVLLGMALAQAGRTNESVAAYRRASELAPDDFVARNNLAVLLGEAGRLDEALGWAQQAYRLAGDEPNVLDTLGWLYLQKGLVERAIALLERATELSSRPGDAHLHLALARQRAGRAEEANTLLLALESSPEAPEALRARAREARTTLR